MNTLTSHETSPKIDEIQIITLNEIPVSNTNELKTTDFDIQVSRINVSICILAIIAFIAAMYLAQAFFLPLLIGILTSYTLSPVVKYLTWCHIPRAVGAALVVAVLIGALSWLGISLGSEATAMIEKLPDATRKIRQQLSDLHPANQSALQNMQEAANQIEGAAADASARSDTPKESKHASEAGGWLHDYVLKQSLELFSVLVQAPIVLLLTYFLLASGEHFRLKLVQFVGPSLTRKKDAVRILDEIDMQIQLYLLSMLVASTLVGVAVWLAFKALGMEHPGIWGIIACLLQFIPYLGPAVTVLTSGIASYLQFGSLIDALATSCVALTISAAIGLAFTTWLQSRFAHINTAVLFISLLFFAWLWGICGLLLGAPIVAIIKVVCDRIDSLKSFGELLGR